MPEVAVRGACAPCPLLRKVNLRFEAFANLYGARQRVTAGRNGAAAGAIAAPPRRKCARTCANASEIALLRRAFDVLSSCVRARACANAKEIDTFGRAPTSFEKLLASARVRARAHVCVFLLRAICVQTWPRHFLDAPFCGRARARAQMRRKSTLSDAVRCYPTRCVRARACARVRACACFCSLSWVSPALSCPLLGPPGLSWVLLASPGLFWPFLASLGLPSPGVSCPLH